MAYLFSGLVALVFALLLGRWMASAQPASVARTLRWTLGVLVGIALIFVLWAGRYQLVAVVLPFLIPALARWRAARRWERSARGPTPGRRSAIDTAFLRMTLDHDSGVLDGEVIAGAYAGRRLGAMSLEELLRLRAECRSDEASLRILDAYLDRTQGAAWREADAAQQKRTADAPSAGGAMTREEAYAILGLQPGADEQAIKVAHRRLMASVHPDRGGSDYLAALLNRARDVLLGHG